MFGAPTLDRIDFVQRESAIEQFRVSAQMFLELRNISAMQRHHGSIGELITASTKKLQNRVLSGRITRISFKYQGKWRERITLAVCKRRIQLRQETKALGVESFTSSHDDARQELCAVFMQPARALDLSLKHSAIESVLIISRAKCGTSLNNPKPSKICSVAHRRSPVPTPHRQMQHLGVSTQNCDYGLAFVVGDRVPQSVGCRVCVNALLQQRPV